MAYWCGPNNAETGVYVFCLMKIIHRKECQSSLVPSLLNCKIEQPCRLVVFFCAKWTWRKLILSLLLSSIQISCEWRVPTKAPLYIIPSEKRKRLMKKDIAVPTGAPLDLTWPANNHRVYQTRATELNFSRTSDCFTMSNKRFIVQPSMHGWKSCDILLGCRLYSLRQSRIFTEWQPASYNMKCSNHNRPCCISTASQWNNDSSDYNILENMFINWSNSKEARQQVF